ncbi:MAG: ABC transporter ATP-binding protein/permease [Defluviitaleaceae bacterium]|nr:ABC transporter ATP-binding protein/permease [Defluviitaleaceae bacterium]
MKRILKAYKDILAIMFAEAPAMATIAFICFIISGLLFPFGVFVRQNVFDGGLAVAQGEMPFSDYYIFLVLVAVMAVLPYLTNGYIFNYVEKRSLLIIRTAYKERILKKLKTIKYEHFENEESMEIIDKACNRVENSVRHLWPMYLSEFTAGIIGSVGVLVIIGNIRWWLLLTVLVPVILETYLSSRTNQNIYNEMETYWKKERKYSALGGFLRSRQFVRDVKAFGTADFLVDNYEKKLNERNRDYESYFFRNIRNILLHSNITRLASVGNAIILLLFFVNGEISVGTFIAVSGLVLTNLYPQLGGITFMFKWAPFHINTFDFYDKFFNLSDEPVATQTELPATFDIEFKDVWFKYPGTENDILRGLSFKVASGEKASIVGENGEGKSTMIKLLLGLFSPDKGEILVGGKNLDEYPLSVRTKIFGPVFQNFLRYSITVAENIGVGYVDDIGNLDKIKTAAQKGKADEFAEKFESQYDTLLGRDFDGGVDLSGGQWQRIAIARAFMGDKPVLLLDEPTSQLDPMAEAALYKEFAEMTASKTAIFITHRLGSTLITDKIFVIAGGKIQETGTHEQLMQTDGIYSTMFNAQKQWYHMNEE